MDVKSNIIVPMIMASLFILILLAMTPWMPQYATSIREFTPIEGAFFRLEGTLKQFQLHETDQNLRKAWICEGEHECVEVHIPVRYIPQIKLGNRLIIEGTWEKQALQVSKVLTKCHS